MNRFQAAKTKFDLVDVVSKFVKLQSSGKDFTGLCPFHKENTPSFRVYSSQQTFFCFGCHAWGDVTDFLTRIGRPDLLDVTPPDPITPVMEKLKGTVRKELLTPRYVLKYMDRAFRDASLKMVDLTTYYRKLNDDEDTVFLLTKFHQYRMVDSFFEILTPRLVSYIQLKRPLEYLWKCWDLLSQDFHFHSFQITHQENLDGKTLQERHGVITTLYKDFIDLFYFLTPIGFETTPENAYNNMSR